eukprot:TRINITY_DN1256_c0_g1_i7.p1 TRINITY_DN1256_c0_g1~~TRINITY_DN1256_c0_g1_i7.p1  ORF type:complete len:173 (-),score=32.03 TRINITY_DN1256_c0_g1_i7:92-610(-)
MCIRDRVNRLGKRMSTEAEICKKNEHVFDYPWEVVMKALWNKYPNKELDFVKFNKVIDMQMVNQNCLKFKKLMFAKKFSMIWMYTIEEIEFDFERKVFTLQSRIIKKSAFFPSIFNVKEYIQYQPCDQLSDKTLYTKQVVGSNLVNKYMDKLNSSFEKGCKIVEEKCKEFLH